MIYINHFYFSLDTEAIENLEVEADLHLHIVLGQG